MMAMILTKSGKCPIRLVAMFEGVFHSEGPKHNRADQVLRETTDVTTAIHRINTVEVRL